MYVSSSKCDGKPVVDMKLPTQASAVVTEGCVTEFTQLPNCWLESEQGVHALLYPDTHKYHLLRK